MRSTRRLSAVTAAASSSARQPSPSVASSLPPAPLPGGLKGRCGTLSVSPPAQDVNGTSAPTGRTWFQKEHVALAARQRGSRPRRRRRRRHRRRRRCAARPSRRAACRRGQTRKAPSRTPGVEHDITMTWTKNRTRHHEDAAEREKTKRRPHLRSRFSRALTTSSRDAVPSRARVPPSRSPTTPPTASRRASRAARAAARRRSRPRRSARAAAARTARPPRARGGSKRARSIDGAWGRYRDRDILYISRSRARSRVVAASLSEGGDAMILDMTPRRVTPLLARESGTSSSVAPV